MAGVGHVAPAATHGIVPYQRNNSVWGGYSMKADVRETYERLLATDPPWDQSAALPWMPPAT